MCEGTPSRIQSDRGEQLVAVSEKLGAWDFVGVLKWAGRKGIEGAYCPSESSTSMGTLSG